jgi:ABC-type Fe3+/spermidine/putrescine transport system ATPase subunit
MLRMVNVSKKLDHQPVIQSVSFQVPAGCFFTLLGDSGTGKTTLLKLIAGLEMPEEGRIFVNSRDLTEVPADRRRIPMIFQQPLLFPHLTVFQNIAFGLEMAGWKQPEIREKVQALMDSLQISELAPGSPALSPAASSSGCPLPGPWRREIPCCSWTSHFPAWTLPCARRWGNW